MSEDDSDADRFFEEAEEYLYGLARTRNLGVAKGRWTHPKLGIMLVHAVFGQIGQLYVTLVLCATDGARKVGQARLWWFLNDRADPFEFKHIERRKPMAEVVINGDSDLEDEIGARFLWLEEQSSIEAAVTGIYGKALSVLQHAEEAQGDVRVALASEIPKGDEEEPA